jgi:NAD(P)-dependent dehydrogenase (short-subunit alcohol dehydrogenase family)
MAPTSKYLSKLQSKRVLVFGGTSGIGFCVAEAAVEYGATVFISSSTSEKLERALTRLRTAYPEASDRIHGYACDLSNKDTQESDIDTLLKKVTNDGADKLDHIAFTAGNLIFDPAQGPPQLAQANAELIFKLSIVRTVAPVIIAKLLPKYMHIAQQSSFTITGSAGSVRPPRGFALPMMGAGGLDALIRGLAVDLKPLRVNLVAPGSIETEMWGGKLPPQALEMFKSRTLVGAVGRPEDTAEAYIYAMKDYYVTGTVLLSEGGAVLA